MNASTRGISKRHGLEVGVVNTLAIIKQRKVTVIQ